MASAAMVSAIVGLLLVLLQAKNVIGDDVPAPLPPRIADHICNGVKCGKGTCKPSASSMFFFECQCDAGWKQTHSDDHNDKYAFLPCVIPKCTLNYTCDQGPPPAPTERPSKLNPCYWADCGRGTCKTNSKPFSHTCECPEGYFNLFDRHSYPCVKQCAIGGDCALLGVHNGTSRAGRSVPRGSISWIIISMFFFATFLCK